MSEKFLTEKQNKSVLENWQNRHNFPKVDCNMELPVRNETECQTYFSAGR